MLENLKELVRKYAGDAIINNPAIPNERNEEAVTDASTSILEGLKNAVSNGNTDDVTDLSKVVQNRRKHPRLLKVLSLDLYKI